MARRVLVVGMNPASDELYTIPPRNTTHWTLPVWMSEVGVHYYSFINACHRPGQVKWWDVDFESLYLASEGYDRVIGLGGFVSRALKLAVIPHFKLPHPSPRNRVLNDKSVVAAKLKELKDWLNE